jgi:phage baseplate assembly protein gpV
VTLYETIRRLVREELGQVRTAELAVVQAQHPHASASDNDNYACTVELRDSGLVLKQVPVATERIGSVTIPAVGELVLVQFLGGDLNSPVITGRLYNEQDRPPPSDDGQWILHVPLGAGDSDAVHVELHAVQKREVLLRLGSALTVTLKDDDPVVEIDVDGGKAAVKIARDGGVTLTSQGSLTVEASTDVALKGANVKIEASGQLTLKGSVVNIN